MLLKKLIKNLPKEKKNIEIKGLSINSKNIKKGFAFVALKGLKTNGEKYIKEAIQRGAKLIICSKNCHFKNSKIPVIKTSDPRNLLSRMSSEFYKSKPKNIIAVTGTNGKTSVADLFYQILNLNNVPVASIGTLGVKFRNKRFKTNLTSPDILTLHQYLEKIKKNKIDNVIIEASSHGLLQKRINHLNIKAGVFTNFSQDHLDYHKTMSSYLKAKLLLFNKILSKKKFVISDRNLKEYKILKKICRKKNLRFIDTSKIKKKLDNNLKLGFNDFQLKNLSMAISAARLCGVKEKKNH